MARLFIPDKKLYSAVMFVQKILKNDTDKTFETACKISANYYKLPVDEVFKVAEKYQHALAPTKGKKYKYFTACCELEDDYELQFLYPHVCRAISEKNNFKVLRWVKHGAEDVPLVRVLVKEYATKAEAEKNVFVDVNEYIKQRKSNH